MDRDAYVKVQKAANNHEALREVEKLDEDEDLSNVWFVSPLRQEVFPVLCG